MSVLRLGGSQSMSGDPGKQGWLAAVEQSLGRLEREAERRGAQVDWSSIELETETDFIDESSLMGPERQLRTTTLRATALAVTG